MTQLRIFSYLPNPRVWKATIAARMCGVEVEVRGAAPEQLAEWLWDFDARPRAEVDPERLKAAERLGRIGFKDSPSTRPTRSSPPIRSGPSRPPSATTARW